MSIAIKQNRVVVLTEDKSISTPSEGSTYIVKMTLIDEDGVVIPLAAVTTLTLSLFARDIVGQPAVNSVTNVNIKNTGRGTLHATSGLLRIHLTPADQSIIDPTCDREWHRGRITVGYNSTDSLPFEFDFQVLNLHRVA